MSDSFDLLSLPMCLNCLIFGGWCYGRSGPGCISLSKAQSHGWDSEHAEHAGSTSQKHADFVSTKTVKFVGTFGFFSRHVLPNFFLESISCIVVPCAMCHVTPVGLLGRLWGSLAARRMPKHWSHGPCHSDLVPEKCHGHGVLSHAA